MGIRCFFGFHPYKNKNQHLVRISALTDISIGRDRLILTVANMVYVGNYHYCIDCGKVTALSLNYGQEESMKDYSFSLRAFKALVDLDSFKDVMEHLVDRTTGNSEYRKTQLDTVLNFSALDDQLKMVASAEQKGITAHCRAVVTYLDRKSSSGEASYQPVEDENVTEINAIIAEHDRLKAVLPLLVHSYLTKA